MSNSISLFSLSKKLAEELAKSRSFNALAENTYGKKWTIEIGFDRLRQDWKSIAPFVVFVPQAEDTDDSGLTLYSVGVLLGIVDSSMTETEIRSLSGLEFLSSSALPELLSCVEKASDSVSGMHFTEHQSEINQESYPLLYCNIALNFLQRAAIGARRR